MRLKRLSILVKLIGIISLWLIFQIFYRTDTSSNGLNSTFHRGVREADESRIFTKMHFGRVFIFGAVAGNSSLNNQSWDLIKVYASTDLRAFVSQTLDCCLKYTFVNKTVRKQVKALQTITTEGLAGRLKTSHFTCPNMECRNGYTPTGVGLTISNELTCQDKDVKYVKPVYPQLETTTKLAIHTQVAFGNIPAELIIEWMETHLYLGVDKVITYYFTDINRNALRTLQYYANSGAMKLHKYIPAQSDLYPRNLSHKDHQTFFDLRLPVYDSFERMSGYTYFGIIDFDEFLIPSQNRPIKQLLDNLREKFENVAAGFLFKSQLYSLTWSPDRNDTDLIISRYINRVATAPENDRPKNIVIPKYIQEGGIRTHFSRARLGKRIIRVPDTEGYIRHYRQCRVGRDATGLGCSTDDSRVVDKSVAEWSSCIKDNVFQARKRIFPNRRPTS